MKFQIKLFPIVFVVTFVAANVFAQIAPPNADAKLWRRALEIHKSAIIVDGHNDVTTPMYDDDFDLAQSNVGKFHSDGDPFHSDIERFRQSGITGEFFSIYVDRKFAENPAVNGGSAARALDLIDATYRATERYPNIFIQSASVADIRRAKREGKIAALMGIEGGHAIENSLADLREFYRLGVRYMTLTHNNTNDWADSCCDAAKHNGLSDFGKDVVREMNRLGMMIDVAHVSDKTMSDVLDVSTAPIIASHSSARHFSDHPRTVSDELLKKIAANKGVVMVNFYPAFIDQKYRDDSKARDAKLKTQLDQLNEQFKTDAKGLQAATKKLLDANPLTLPAYTKIIDHIDYIKTLVGIDYVGIGSDFDGVPSLPAPMTGAENLAWITYEMLRRGYSESDVRKVLGENFLRVFAAVEKNANTNNRKISGDGNLRKIKN